MIRKIHENYEKHQDIWAEIRSFDFQEMKHVYH
jgi:hypothetical protein